MLALLFLANETGGCSFWTSGLQEDIVALVPYVVVIDDIGRNLVYLAPQRYHTRYIELATRRKLTPGVNGAPLKVFQGLDDRKSLNNESPCPRLFSVLASPELYEDHIASI